MLYTVGLQAVMVASRRARTMDRILMAIGLRMMMPTMAVVLISRGLMVAMRAAEYMLFHLLKSP